MSAFFVLNEQEYLWDDVADVVISSNLSTTLSFYPSFFRYNDVGDVVSQALLLTLCMGVKRPIQMWHDVMQCLGDDVADVVISSNLSTALSFYPSFFRYNDVGDVVSQALF